MWTSSKNDTASDDDIKKQLRHGLPSDQMSSEQMERILGFGVGHQIAQLNAHLNNLKIGGFNGHDVDDFDDTLF